MGLWWLAGRICLTFQRDSSYMCIVKSHGHSYINLLLALLLLFATTGVTLSKHYCMGRLMSIEINEHTAGCQDTEQRSMPCCENIIQELKVDHLLKSDVDLDLGGEWFLSKTVAYVLMDADPKVVSYPAPDLHSPPLLQKDLPVLLRTFLI